MMSNLHSVGLMQFLTEASNYAQQIISTPADIDKVVKFINDNQEWMSFLAQHPGEIREPVKMLSERLREIGSVEGKEAANRIDQYLIDDVFFAHGVMKVDLPHTGKYMCDPEMENALASAYVDESIQEIYKDVTIEEINEYLPRFRDLGFRDADEVITFLINSPEKENLIYINFDGLPLNNDQFENLIKNCPNLLYIEIPGSLLSGDALKHIANLTELQALNIEGCRQLESDALRHIVNLKKLRSLVISLCDQLEADSLKHLANLTSLQELHFGRCNQFEGDALKYLMNIKSLHVLLIKGCKQLERSILALPEIPWYFIA